MLKEILIMKNKYRRDFETSNDNTMKLTKAEQEAIQKQREQIISKIEGDAISPAARKLLEENQQRIEKQKSEKLSKKNMELYVNLDKENAQNGEDVEMPAVEKRGIRLNSSIPEDEDFGL